MAFVNHELSINPLFMDVLSDKFWLSGADDTDELAGGQTLGRLLVATWQDGLVGGPTEAELDLVKNYGETFACRVTDPVADVQTSMFYKQDPRIRTFDFAVGLAFDHPPSNRSFEIAYDTRSSELTMRSAGAMVAAYGAILGTELDEPRALLASYAQEFFDGFVD